MNKIFKIISDVVLVLAIVLFLISVIMPSFLKNVEETVFRLPILANIWIVMCAVVGVVLTSAKNGTAKRVGHGLTVGSFAIAFAIASSCVTSESFSVSGILMIISVIALVIHYIFLFIVTYFDFE